MGRFAVATFLGFAVLAVASSTAVRALEEQRGVVPPGMQSPADPKANVQSEQSSQSGGTEIRIPGLGKLGTLPKMDFGLELLYGADPSSPAHDQPVTPGEEPQDLMIHGSMKHRF